MKPVFLLLAFLAAAAVLLWKICSRVKKKRLPEPGRINIRILVKNQETWMEGFVRKLFRVIKDSDRLEVFLVDDGSSDRTADILNCLERIYPLRTLTAGEDSTINNCGPVTGPGPSMVLRFDVRGLKGRDLLNAPLFCHLSHLNEGKSQVLSK
ncbi:glycosyltransferase [Pelotomaculum propionicicum]|uniref:glycosyltransferase n=1 Tax=Pelotomaculum propionicicum TaxID=258475 RepID=UPI003B80A360